MLGLPLCGLLGHSKLIKQKWVQEIWKPPMQILSLCDKIRNKGTPQGKGQRAVGWKPLSWPGSLDGAMLQLLSAAWLLCWQGPMPSLQAFSCMGSSQAHWSMQGIFLDLGITPGQALKKCGDGAGGLSPKLSRGMVLTPENGSNFSLVVTRN